MQEDTITYDSLHSRPLPDWLMNQKQGSTAMQSKEIKLRTDYALDISIAVTAGLLFLIVLTLTLYIKRRQNKS